MNWFAGKKRILLISLSKKTQILNEESHMNDGWFKALDWRKEPP